ncbi:YihY/virulence factor BrkB family protein [Victivallis sp. Marseille-Q1083]|uniref:YihY/virulence factor BrkB family protein n=1 Tax=Victivallis sp. Marseille-Q1083 TaxID=2717288 RepID=UPI00158B8C09|nr:YihY/virulence factor BrkB family protein [Victivallis sp. Marseille-Q1083]
MDLKPWKERATRARNFLFSDIWFMNFQPLPRTKRLLFRALKVAMLLFSNLKADSCYLRASALTFYSIFAVVPLAALLFGIAKGFGLETKLYTTLMEKFSDQQVVIQHIYNFAERTLEHTRGGLIAGIGVVVLLFTILKMIGNIESSFNHIWSVKINRSWFRKFTDYTSLLLVCPIFLISTAGVNTLFRRFTAEGAWLEALAQPMSAFSIRLLPFVMSWLIFTLIYRFMPNTRVQFKAALLSGIISGTVYQLWQMLYIGIQVKLSSYNAIYGSLSALPLFLLWMQYSWVIVLFGTELAFVLQNVDNIEFEPGASRPSIRLRRAVSLLLATLVVKDFKEGATPPTSEELARRCEIPFRLTEDLLYQLTLAKILCRAVDEQGIGKFGFLPAMPLEKLTIAEVLDRLDNLSSGPEPIPPMAEYRTIERILERLREVNAFSEQNLQLQILFDTEAADRQFVKNTLPPTETAG